MKKQPLINGSAIFTNSVNTEHRSVTDYKLVAEFAGHCRGLGLKIVLTQGTFDLIHIGHARYMEEAKKHGDVLIVGVDSDAKVRARKGPDRPVVPQTERIEMLTHLRSVDLVVLKEMNAAKWALIKAVKPDVLIATKETYDQAEIKALEKICGEVVVLNPMATTSTSAKIRLLQINTAKKLEKALTPRLIQAIEETLRGVKGDK